MTLGEAATWYDNELSARYEREEIRAIFELIADHFLGINRSRLMILKYDQLRQRQYAKLLASLTALKTGKPVQYVIGETVFFGLTFNVNAAVLIPRPETEELVDWVLKSKEQPAAGQEYTLLDIGTGSGCIAISLKKNWPAATVVALDVSAEALQVAAGNAVMNHTDVQWRHLDILRTKSIPDTNKGEERMLFDRIVSNPPYITNSEKWAIAGHVINHEPHTALFVDDRHPLVFYEAIANFATGNLKPGGALFLEINEAYGPKVVALLKNKGFKEVVLRKDLNGKDRMVRAELPNAGSSAI